MSIGDPVPRPDGPAKVTGGAKYAADQSVPGILHAVYVGAPIPAGRVASIDIASALAAPGVVRVLTHRDLPRLASAPVLPLASSFMPMQGNEIRHEGQPVAIVLGETLEAAQHGARLLGITYERAAFRAPDTSEVEAPDPASGYVGYFEGTEFRKGDIEASLATAATRHEAVYVQPSRHVNPMEPSATLARWDDDRLTVFDAVQHGYNQQFVLASVFGITPENVRVVCPHTGGGFGSKGYVWPHEILAAAAAQVVGRPVKLVLTRAQMYANVGYQPQMEQAITLGVDSGGRLTSLKHEVVGLTSVSDDYVDFATEASKGLYATPAMYLRQRVRRAHVNLPTPMRAPIDGPGTWALESAMDELAHRLGMDPLDLRLANYAEVNPADGRPWSSKKLREAYEEGARLFGWRERPREPRRDGDWLVGTGMASCTMGTFRFPSTVRVRLRADGTAVIEGGFHDIGSGTLTVFPQIAADVLGLDPGAISCEMGDTALPQTGPAYGSSSTMGVGGAVLYAAQDVRTKLAGLAGLSPDEGELADGRIRRRGQADGVPVAELLRQAGVSELVGEGRFALPNDAPFEGDGKGTPYAMRTFGAIFVEVGVDAALGLLRLRRAVGSYSVGRIINPRTARAQMTGAIIWGWGMAAMEASHHEPTLGRWLSKNLAGVAIPVNADIPGDLQIHFVDEFDAHASPLGAKGIGELGATGVAAAVANAVFHATGKRVRELPITPDKLVNPADRASHE
jgi:xanthine dehydrogenase YagR molybdenum-binding subunit